MSLEQAILDHASALRELAAALIQVNGIATSETAAAISSANKTAKAETKQPEVKKPAAKPEATVAAAPTYDTVAARVVELSQTKGREIAVALLQRHGVKRATELKTDQYADVLKDIDAIFDGTYDPEASDALA